MERRTETRYSHRLKVHFLEHGTDKTFLGYTTNISKTGMFVQAGHIVLQGKRVRVTLESDGSMSAIEAKVARVRRSLNAFTPSGMGIRFLTVEEIVSELLPETDSPAGKAEGPDDEVLRVKIPSREKFKEILNRDLATGGLYIPTKTPPALNEIVNVELSIDEAGTAPVRFQARVVHRMEPAGPDGTVGGNLLAGVGVELLNLDQTLPALRAIAQAS